MMLSGQLYCFRSEVTAASLKAFGGWQDFCVVICFRSEVTAASLKGVCR